MRPTRAVSASVALALSAAAQSVPAWSDLTGLGPINQANVVSIGKLVTYDDAGVLHAWSAFTRTWTAYPYSGAASRRLTNDCLLVRDGTMWTAFSSYSGRYAPLAVSPTAQLVNPSGQDNDSILCVLDQGVLHAFSCFVGAWVSRPVSANALIAVQRHVAVLADGNLIAGMDALTGQWHDQTVAAAATAVTCDGFAGAAQSPTTWHGFSGMHGTWVAAPAFPAATRVRNDDWILWHDGTQVTAFSGLQGTMVNAAFPAFATMASEDLFGLFATATGPVAFSAITGQFAAIPASPTAVASTSVNVALLVDGLSVVGFSPIRGTAAVIALDAQSVGVAGGIGYAIERTTGLPRLFSALTGLWHTPPGDVLAAAPVLTTTLAVLTTGAGVRAFSGRTGVFVPLVAPGLVVEANTNSAPAAVWNSGTIWAFDARTDTWLPAALGGGGAPTTLIWRTQIDVIDGNRVLGFGSQAGNWHAAPLPEPWIGGRAGSESASIVTNQHVLAFSGIPEPTSLSQFPEFRRVFPAGATFRLQLRLPQGDAAFLAGGPRAAQPTILPGLGTLWIDPAFMATSFTLPDPGEDRKSFGFAVPATPALRGSEWFFQALVLSGGGGMHLTEAGSVLVL